MSDNDMAPASPADGLRRATRLHMSLAVADLDRSIRFYCDVFGYAAAFRADDLKDWVARLTARAGLTCRLAQLARQGDVLELIEFRDGDAVVSSGSGPVPYGHVAFSTPDMDAALDAARRAGASLMGEVVLFPEGRSAYCREPGGSVFELEEVTP